MKYFLIILIIYKFAFTYAYADIINKIEVKNNNRITKETIITFGNIELGKDYNQEQLNNVLIDLYSTNFFSDIKFDVQGDVLVVEVEERKIIQQIVLNGVPAEKTKKANGGIMRKMLRAGDDPRDFEDEVDVQETDVDVIELMKDQGIPMGEQVKSRKEGIMQMAGETPEEERDMEFNIELKEFLNENPGATVDDFIKIKMLEAKLRREARDEILARITLAGGSFPDLSKDGEITQETKSMIFVKGKIFNNQNKKISTFSGILKKIRSK